MFTSESTIGAKLGYEVGNGNQGGAVEAQLHKQHKNPTLTVDGVLMVDGKLLLVRRGHEPEKGKLALPGGIVEYGETTEEAVVRELKEETGIITRPVELLGVYSDPHRDPRGHFITVAYVLVQEDGDLRAGEDAEDAIFKPIEDITSLAFDHNKIMADYLRLREKKSCEGQSKERIAGN